MSDKPREFWMSRRHMDINASPIKCEYEETRWYPSEQFEAMKLERDALAAENERLRDALKRIADYECGPIVDASFDNPTDAMIARKALEK